MNLWRAGCEGTRTSGSEGGPRKRTGRKADTAPRSDPTIWPETLAAATGASTRELMARLGHSTPRARLIYQHATEQRDRPIAAGIDAMLEAAAKAEGTNEASIHALESSWRSANQA